MATTVIRLWPLNQNPALLVLSISLASRSALGKVGRYIQTCPQPAATGDANATGAKGNRLTL